MILTLVLSAVTMLGLFLLLWSAVGFVQDKRFFGSAHPDLLAVVKPKSERFKGQHALGYILAVFALILNIGPIVIGIYNGVQNGFGFGGFFLRFALMVILLKAFDIFFFDWILLCNSNFFPHYYPETKDIIGHQLFGYNFVSHAIHVAVYLIVATGLSWVCTLF